MRGRCGSGTGRGIWQRAGRAGGVGRAEVGERGRVSGAGPCGRETGRWERKTGPTGNGQAGWARGERERAELRGKEEKAGPAGLVREKGTRAVRWVGPAQMERVSRAELGLLCWICSFSFSSSFLFFFWFSNFTQTIEFKHEFEFQP